MDKDNLFTYIVNKFPFVEKLANFLPAEEPALKVPKEIFFELAHLLKEDPSLNFDYLSFITAVDYADRLEVVYHLFSFEHRHKIFLKIDVPRDKSEISSLIGLWPTANWHERETYDLLGINFIGHPDLRRILLPVDWSEGPPLRKDYQRQTDKYD